MASLSYRRVQHDLFPTVWLSVTAHDHRSADTIERSADREALSLNVISDSAVAEDIIGVVDDLDEL
ncbi:hypothetical protein C8039_06580 [Halogeometricum sp. wsp3]|nr:hypothetical protein C8039_06580 [Halogeometricum sp. wsp3]